jgi:hypothetical protein
MSNRGDRGPHNPTDRPASAGHCCGTFAERALAVEVDIDGAVVTASNAFGVHGMLR